LLVPRLTTAQRTTISVPATGLLVFDTNLNSFYYWNGSSWTNLTSGSASGIWGYNSPYVYLNSTTNKLGIGTTTPFGKMEVKSDNTLGANDPIFQVVNNNGDTVFAVYQQGVRVNVEDSPGKATSSKGGFAVGGFSPSKGTFTNEFLRVTPDSVRVYIEDNPAKATASKGGFAVGGFSPSKTTVTNYLDLTPNNYFIGHGSGSANTTGLYNSFIGFNSGLSNTTASNNTFMGYKSGNQTTTGEGNVAIGTNSGLNNIDGWYNVFIGYDAGNKNLASNNTFVGTGSGQENTTGLNNTFYGNSSGFGNSTGIENTYIGNSAGAYNFTGNYNTHLGFDAGSGADDYQAFVGNHNVFIGYKCGDKIINNSKNTFLGNFSGYNCEYGNRNVFLGYRAGFNETTSDKLYIANGATSDSTLIYGNFSSKFLLVNGSLKVNGILYDLDSDAGTNGQILSSTGSGTNWINAPTSPWSTSGLNTYYNSGNVGIGTSSPAQKLDVAGDIKLNNSLYFTTGNFSIFNGNSRKVMDSWWSSSLGATGLNVGDYTAINSAYDWSVNEPSSIITSNSYPLLVTTGISSNPGVAYQNTLMVMNSSGYLGIGTTAPTSKVHAVDIQTTNDNPAVYGSHSVTDNYGIGVKGEGKWKGVYGVSSSAIGSATAVRGDASGSAASKYGVYGYASGTNTNYGIYGSASGGTTNYAGYFDGNVHVNGTLSKSAGTFKIDHPQDPENKYLIHSFVESPDMKNIYDGVATLDNQGKATITLPSYFGSLNKDFRYQLTAIGVAAPNLHIEQKVQNNTFIIAGGSAGMEISWQVTGIRKDPYAIQNPIVVEEEKLQQDKGKYLNPELYNQPAEKSMYKVSEK
ncbi:MAG: hypothetical protein A2033_00665, partial [Bacteroidetes bacterium GWA2_31_9]